MFSSYIYIFFLYFNEQKSKKFKNNLLLNDFKINIKKTGDEYNLIMAVFGPSLF